MEFKVVERGQINGSEVKDEYVQALIDTADTEKAVEITLPQETNFTNWQSTLRNRLKKHSLRLRMKWDKGKRTVTAWTERTE